MALPILAPQPTGHPASLPPAPDKASVAQKVAPSSRGDASRDAQSRHAGSGDSQKAAPPSAIQRKIMEILEQQAKEQARETERIAQSAADDEADARIRDDKADAADAARSDAAAETKTAEPPVAAPAQASEPPRPRSQTETRPAHAAGADARAAESREATEPQD
ncbi:hypothetical protein [Sedimentitalea sp. HM32M-2]|uniref:hypothetical protein n=1 Tax=Sedimentitalea sp. HM32M-2 TaxID=3351566 RepID=UPI0036D38A22